MIGDVPLEPWEVGALVTAGAVGGAGLFAALAYRRQVAAAHKLLDLLDALVEERDQLRARRAEFERGPPDADDV